MADEQEKIKMFKELCGADDGFARSFLEANAWNLEAATMMFFEGNAPVNPAKRPLSPPGASLGAVDDDLISKIVAEQRVSVEDARAIAAAGFGGGDDDGVRAPIARTTGRLVSQSSGFSGLGGAVAGAQVKFRNFEQEIRQIEALTREKRLEEQRNGLGGSSAAFDTELALGARQVSARQGHEDGEDDYDYVDDNGGAAQEQQSLQTLFQPPRDILFAGSFENAREFARINKRWILVNIQQDDEFFSYVLNRDLWQSDLIKDIVTSSFVFFQHDHNDSEAQQYSRFYKPTDFPHIAVIDPRTGEQVLLLNLKTKANESDPNDLRSAFLDKVSSFLDANSMGAPPAAAPRPAVQEAPRDLPKPSATVQPAPAPPPEPQGQSLVEAQDSSVQSSGMKIAYEPLESEPDKSHADATQVRIRLFSGKTINRAFLTSQRVSQLFALVASEVPETETRPFDMLVAGFPPKSLKDSKDRTLAEEGLQRATLSVRWVSG